MPRQRWIKSTLVDAILFIGVLLLVGHLSVYSWERFIVQSELSQMRTSLHSLKETLAQIGNAYDNLHKELQVLEKKQLPPGLKKIKPITSTEHICQKPALDRRRLHDVQVRTLLLAAKEQEKSLKSNKTTNNSAQMESKNIETFLKQNPAKNATTITRYPRKSTGVGQDKCFAMEQCRYACPNGHRCHKEFNGCRDQHLHNNWKY